MILTCPNCSTQYVVKDGAIPPQGRQVRCASCKHSWHQNPEEGAADAADSTAAPIAAGAAAVLQPEYGEAPEGRPAEVAADVPEETSGETAAYEDAAAEAPEGEDESIAEAVMIEPRSGPEAEMRAYEQAMIEPGPEAQPADPALRDSVYDHVPPQTETATAPAADWREPPEAEPDEDFSPFALANDEEPRSRRPWVAIFVGVLVIVALAAMFWFLAPETWKNRVGLAGSSASPLALVTTHMDRQRLESGNELLTVTGRVINPTDKEQPVPPLQAQLKTRSGQVVYSWTIAPPAQSLPAGASASFNSAEVNVPPGGEELTLTVGASRS